MSAGCVNRAQMLEALEVMTAVCERDRLFDDWQAAARLPDADAAGEIYLRFGGARRRAATLNEAYRARWGQ